MPDHSRDAVRCREGIVRREVGNEVLLFDPRSEALHVLNPAASVVWDALQRESSPAELEALLRAEFATEPGDPVAADVGHILVQFLERDLILRASE